jgi:excisionase family DNA binding protein
MEKLTCTVKEACAALSLGRSKFYELVGAGEIDTIKIGTRTLVKVASLLRVVEGNSLSTNQATIKSRIATYGHGLVRTTAVAKPHEPLHKHRPRSSAAVR